MRFLEPLILWGLPAILLPILIHLLNRLRYRSVKWAAMMFLISATRSSIRRARLRHWLILACRTLIFLLLILALARPIVGGWLGRAGAGSPETVIILLDRSASMETMEPRHRKTRREHAIELLASAEESLGYSSRYVLIESVFMKPQEVAGIAAIGEMSMASATDTAADISAMLSAAQNYMVRNRTGRTEIWIVSDMQKSNWSPESARWASLNAQMASLPQDLFIRILSLAGGHNDNLSVSLSDIVRKTAGDLDQVSLALELAAPNPRTDSFPLTVTLDGQRTQTDVVLKRPILQVMQDLDIAAEEDEFGWGKAEIPADSNPSDNTCYFAYGKAISLSAAILSEESRSSRPLTLAAAPSEDVAGLSSLSISPLELDTLEFEALSLLVYQASDAGEDLSEIVTPFVEQGGTILIFPSESDDTTDAFGLKWTDIETAAEKELFRVSTWERNDGLLADTSDGNALPVAALKFKKRRIPEFNEDEWFPLANFSDGTPFLMRRKIGRGYAFTCTSLPDGRWSNLSDGRVLVPMIQRAMQIGSRRLRNVANAACGEWTPPKGSGPWKPAHGPEQSNPRWRAGVYRWDSEVVALNRPAAEDDPEVLDAEDAGNLLGENRVYIAEGLSETRPDTVQSEIGGVLLYIALLFVAMESLLLISARLPRANKQVS